MFNVLWFIGKTLFIVLAVFGLTKLLTKKGNPPKGKIIEGEIVEEKKEVKP